MRPRDVALVVLCNIAWGLNVLAVELTVKTIPPMTAGLFRFVLLFLLCLPGLRVVPGRMRLVMAVALCHGALFISFVNLAFLYADNVNALVIVQQLGTPLTLLLAVLFLGERIHLPRIIGIGLAVVGVLLTSFDPAVVHERLGLLYTLLATLFFSIGALVLRRLAGVRPLTIYAWIAGLSIPLLGALSLALEPGALARSLDLPVAAFWPVAFSALGSSFIGQQGFAYLLQRYPVTTVAPLFLPSPLVSVLAGVLVLDAELTPGMAIAGLLVLLGVTIIALRTPRAVQPAEVPT